MSKSSHESPKRGGLSFSSSHSSKETERRRLENMFAKFTRQQKEQEDQESNQEINAEVHSITLSALPMISKVAMLNSSNSAVGRWIRSGYMAMATHAAKRMRHASRLKALQRTPYPMVLARIKLLLDRLQVRSSSPITHSNSHHPTGSLMVWFMEPLSRF